jgi:hypothetical protein
MPEPFLLSRLPSLYSIVAMTTNVSVAHNDDPVRRVLAGALLVFPCVFVAVFIMHFRHLADFLHFRWHYEPRAPERVVGVLIAAQNRWPLIHDPHMIAYLFLPVFPLCAFAMYLLGRKARPLLSAVAMMITITGTIYMGGVFGMWTAFYRGLGQVDPKYLEGATATFAAMTSTQGAFLVTTTLAKLVMIGLAVQALTLWGLRTVPAWAVACVVFGCSLFLLFWDLDNWMLIGTLFMAAGFLPMRKRLLSDAEKVPAVSAARD